MRRFHPDDARLAANLIEAGHLIMKRQEAAKYARRKRQRQHWDLAYESLSNTIDHAAEALGMTENELAGLRGEA